MENNLLRNIRIGFALSFFLLIISTTASYLSIINLLETSEEVEHTNQIINNLELTLSSLKDAETGQRGYLLTDNKNYLKPYYDGVTAVRKYYAAIIKLTKSNPEQRLRSAALKELIEKRLYTLQDIINDNRISESKLDKGKVEMDRCRQVVQDFKQIEINKLKEKSISANSYATYTPIIIIITSIISLITALFFYKRVMGDYEKRIELQNDLIAKDKEINTRINIIQNIADKISSGDYSLRLNEEENDSLGKLSFALNKMSVSLQSSFESLNLKEWLQNSIARVNESLVGEKSLEILLSDIIQELCILTSSEVGSIYLVEDNSLNFVKGYAFIPHIDKQKIVFGEASIGQVAVSLKPKLITDVDHDSIQIHHTLGAIKPKQIYTFPIIYNNKCLGVIEIASTNFYNDNHITLIQQTTNNISIAITAAINRNLLKNLLEETQVQSEELQIQQKELEAKNRELEIQAQKLLTSEEELKVQQEELMQSNAELEEQTKQLEENNLVIINSNKEIIEQSKLIEQSTKYKSQFLANMSHELRTPLNSILLLSRMLSDNEGKNLTQDQIESAKVIQNSGMGLLNLIDEILDLSKIEAGKMEVDETDFSLNELVKEWKQLFNPIALDKSILFKIDYHDDQNLTIKTDRQKLDQIIKNLISNALKFTSVGEVALNITYTKEYPRLITFAVSDTGIGISSDKQQLIFNAFQQEDGSTKRKFGGTGLGLSISKEFAKLLGGTIQLESEVGVGSKFSLIFPLDPTENSNIIPKKLNKKEESLISNSSFVSTTIPNDLPDDRNGIVNGDKVILIIEDDINFASTLKKFALEKGYKSLIAVRGDVGVELAIQFIPTAILLDIQLPIMDGWQVIDKLKSNISTRHIPVHMMSSYRMRKEGLLKGAIEFLDKPIQDEQLNLVFETIEKALKKHKKVIIVEENNKHALALSEYLKNFNIQTQVNNNPQDIISTLNADEMNCVILDMGLPDHHAYETLELIKNSKGLEDVPILIFTGKSLSKFEQNKIKQYADSIILKTAQSYQRLLNEVEIFLHVVNEKQSFETSKTFSNDILSGKNVLLADDDMRNIFSLTKALESAKMNVLTATNGLESLELLKNSVDKVDIILMDMMMPEMDGYETIMKIRENVQFVKTPIIAVTARAMVGDREKCIEVGASDYISKPVDMDQLLSLLRVWLYN